MPPTTPEKPEPRSPPTDRHGRGWFRTVIRKGDQHDVLFKNTYNDLMVTVAQKLSYEEADKLKNTLNQHISALDNTPEERTINGD